MSKRIIIYFIILLIPSCIYSYGKKIDKLSNKEDISTYDIYIDFFLDKKLEEKANSYGIKKYNPKIATSGCFAEVKYFYNNDSPDPRMIANIASIFTFFILPYLEHTETLEYSVKILDIKNEKVLEKFTITETINEWVGISLILFNKIDSHNILERMRIDSKQRLDQELFSRITSEAVKFNECKK